MIKRSILPLLLPLFLSAIAKGADDPAAWAAENLNAGKYADAEALLQKALPDLPAGSPQRRAVVKLLIETLRITGKTAQAHALCDETIKAGEKDNEAQLLKAELNIETGKYKEAREIYDKVVAAEPKNERAWAMRTFVQRIFSDRAGLKTTADHFFELYQTKQAYFNSDDVADPLELAYIALGVQDENAKDAFETGFLFAEELVDKRNLHVPEIYLWSAHLAHEKYAFGLAMERYDKLLKMRPKLPDALAGKAAIILQTMHKLDDVEKLLNESLSINPNHIESHLIYASIHLEEERPAEARKHIDAALQANPNDLHALSLLAAYYVDSGKMDQFAEIEKRAVAIHPKCADFYCDIGESLENKRGFNLAAKYYQKAVDIDPENWRGYYGLGMNTSRQGAYAEELGKALLLKAFNKNKFNVWARNMISALDRIIGDKEQDVPPVYAQSKTKHFTLKFFGKEADIVRPYMEEWAEASYDRQVKLFGYEPEGPLSIELCASFQDQAARTVGLPNLGALGVCFGKLCTVVSPREGMNKTIHPPFNWRKVMEHEFGHVMALQLSEFRVPRWYTEAFSTYLEDDPRIEGDRMMIDAIAKGQLKDISKMNEYFRTNPLMAYVHGRYIIEYIANTFGFDAHIKALKLFQKGKNLEETLQEVTGKSIAELNEGQLKFVKECFSHVKLRPSIDQAAVVKLELAAKDEDASAQSLAEFAIVQLGARRADVAKALAERALAKDSKCVDALNVLASIAYDKKDFETAKKRFEESTGIDAQRSFTAWHKLGIIYKKEGRTTAAINALEAARKMYPRYIGPDNPHYELPELYEDMEPAQNDKALSVWRDAVKINPQDPEAAMKGLKLAMKLKDFKAAAEFSQAYAEIDPYNSEAHQLGGKAYESLNDFPHAAREYAVGTISNAKDVECWLGLARVRKAQGEKAEALKAAEGALEIDGTSTEAKALRQELK